MGPRTSLATAGAGQRGDHAASTGSGGNGIYVAGNAANNLIEGDYIGVSKAGTPLPNAGDGIVILGASNNTIGGTSSGARNIISANIGAGVRIMGGTGGSPANANIIQGNYVRTNSAGQVPSAGTPRLANHDGVVVEDGASNNTIGCSTSGVTFGGVIVNDPASNIIAGNAHDGVAIIATTTTASGNRISQNQIFDNGDMGIDLGADGITAPMTMSVRRPPLQTTGKAIRLSTTSRPAQACFPFMSRSPSVTTGPTKTGVAGPKYTVEFYTNSGTDVAGLSEGQQFLGLWTVLGNQMMTVPLALTANGTQYITGITIDANGNTSEFSPCRDVLRESVVTAQRSGQSAKPTSITLMFSPRLGTTLMSLQRAAQICDVDHFNWIQTITGLPSDDEQFLYPLEDTNGNAVQFPPPQNLRAYPPTTDGPVPSPESGYGVHSDTAMKRDPQDYPTGDKQVDNRGPVDNYIYYINEDPSDLASYYYTLDAKTGKFAVSTTYNTANGLVLTMRPGSPRL